MSGVTNFLGDPKVHDTVLITMIVSSFLAAIRRIKSPVKWWHVGWNFLYDWAVGFWSMKTGQPLQPVETLHTQTSEPTPSGPKTSEATLTSLSPVPNPQ